MATTINADITNGVVITPDTSGELELQSNGTTVLKIDSPTGSLTIPVGTTAERPVSPTVGMMRYNTTEAYYEQYDGSAWVESGGSAYDAPTTSTGYFALPSGTTAQRPVSPATGDTRYNTTLGQIEVYNTIGGWKIAGEAGNIYPSYTASYLVIAGGGGGGSGGGGAGAGGYRTSTASITQNSVYIVTVGAGGAGGTSSANGGYGNNSVFSGSGITTITSTRGGGGGGRNLAGLAGGSGGGSGVSSSTRSGGAGTAGQGNNGGNNFGGANFGSGGGGGAGAVGAVGTSSKGGNGGNGLASSITGSSVTRAGGGGGGRYNGDTQASGGSGGGGTGGNPNTAGAVNTGSGGGGGRSENFAGAAGGSGIVILSVPTANYSGTTTGNPTVTTSGANTILQYTSSGTYTA